MKITKLTIALIVLTATVSCAASLPPAARGAKTLLILADAGPLHLTVVKRDLNIYEGEDELYADIVGPLRDELSHIELPDDGNAAEGGGPAEEYQQAELTVQCRAAGVYRLQIRGSGDMVYGVQMSADRYVVEGDITFSHGGVGGSIFFQPPEEAFTIEGRAMHNPGMQRVPLLNARGETIAQMDLDSTQEPTTLQFEAGPRDGPWQLVVDTLDVAFEIPAVTHWTAAEGAWFDAGSTRWMLLPYRTARYLQPGEGTMVEFTLRNSTARADRFEVHLDADPGLRASVVEPDMPVGLEPEETAPVRVAIEADEDLDRDLRPQTVVTARSTSQPQVSASSLIEVRVGAGPVAEPLDMPIVLRPYAHEGWQFGYAPKYMRNETYFDPGNRPVIRQRTESRYGTTGVFTLADDLTWVHRGFEDALREAYPDYRTSYGGGFQGAKVAFDGSGGMYTPLRLVLEGGGRPVVLLFSPDRGRSWQVLQMRGTVADIEQFTGHNAPDMPPPVLGYEHTADHPARFCTHNDLWLYTPTREGDTLVLGEPVKVAESVIGACQHSGGPASCVTREGRTHIVWGEVSGAPDGSGADERGVPTYVATYNRATGRVGEKVLLGHAPPVNDVHNVPAITMDSEGYLHVLLGAHGQPFQYTRSMRPNDAYGGWTDAEPILTSDYVTDEGETGRQTYISLVCDADDTLHTAFRQWRRGVDDYHSGSNYAALSVQHRPAGGEWSDAQPLVIGAVRGYSIWYHKLTVDRLGDMWLSYSYWTSDETYQGQFPDRYHHRAVLLSRDGGVTWKLAETADFVEGVRLHAQR